MAEEIPPEAIKRAVELWDADPENDIRDAFARFIAQVSDAAKSAVVHSTGTPPSPLGLSAAHNLLAPFILPDPLDPLRAVIAEAFEAVWAEARAGLSRDDIVNGLTDQLHKRGIELGQS